MNSRILANQTLLSMSLFHSKSFIKYIYLRMDILNSCTESSKKCLKNCIKKQKNEVHSQNKVIFQTVKAQKNIQIMKEKYFDTKKSLKHRKPSKKINHSEVHTNHQERALRNFPAKQSEIQKFGQAFHRAHFQSTPQLKPSHRRIETFSFISPPSIYPNNIHDKFQALPNKNVFKKKLFTKPTVYETKKVNFSYFMPQTTKNIISYPTDSTEKNSLPKTIQSHFEKPPIDYLLSNPMQMILSQQQLPKNSKYQLKEDQKEISKSIKYPKENIYSQAEYKNERQEEEKTLKPQNQQKRKRKKSFIPEVKVQKRSQHGRSRSDFHHQLHPWHQLIESSNFDEEDHSNIGNFSRDFEAEEKESIPHNTIHLPRVNTSELPQNIKQEESQNDSQNQVKLIQSPSNNGRLAEMEFWQKTRSINDSNQDQFSDVLQQCQKDTKGLKFRKFLTLPVDTINKLSEQSSFSTLNFRNVRSRKQSMREST